MTVRDGSHRSAHRRHHRSRAQTDLPERAPRHLHRGVTNEPAPDEDIVYSPPPVRCRPGFRRVPLSHSWTSRRRPRPHRRPPHRRSGPRTTRPPRRCRRHPSRRAGQLAGRTPATIGGVPVDGMVPVSTGESVHLGATRLVLSGSTLADGWEWPPLGPATGTEETRLLASPSAGDRCPRPATTGCTRCQCPAITW